MGVTSFTQEFKCSVAPPRMFKALILDANNLLPKLLPQFIKSIQTIQGEGGAGSIEQINVNEGGQNKYVKHRIDEVDEKELVCKYTVIEGDLLGEKLESIFHEVKFEAASDGGCIAKMTNRYHIIGESEIDKQEVEAGQEKIIGMYKVVEKYLLDNPQVYA